MMMQRSVGDVSYDAVRVFSATLAQERARLGDRFTAWIQENPGLSVVKTIVTQSSDEAFHCLTMTVFYRQGGRLPGESAPPASGP